jgi:hypothetical protein
MKSLEQQQQTISEHSNVSMQNFALLTHKFTTAVSYITNLLLLLWSQYVFCRCAVCLGDYQKNEVLRQLPVCSHIFHKDCVDEWLVKNSTCPLCRTLLFQQEILLMMERPLHCPPWQLQLPSTTHTTELLILPRTNSNSNSTAAEESNTIPTGEIRHLPHLHMEEMPQEEGVAGEHRIQIDCS